MSATPVSPPPALGNDEADRAGQATTRAGWLVPGIRRLSAGEAEFNPIITADGEGTVAS